MVEHSAVNRRVASSNLARGATFLPETDLLTQHVTTLLCGCNRVQVRASQPEVQIRSRPVPPPVCEPPRLPLPCSLTLLFAWPSQRIKSSGACCFLNHVVRKRRNA